MCPLRCVDGVDEKQEPAAKTAVVGEHTEGVVGGVGDEGKARGGKNREDERRK